MPVNPPPGEVGGPFAKHSRRGTSQRPQGTFSCLLKSALLQSMLWQKQDDLQRQQRCARSSSEANQRVPGMSTLHMEAAGRKPIAHGLFMGNSLIMRHEYTKDHA